MLSPKYLDGIPLDSRAARPDGFLQAEQVEAAQEKIRTLDDLAAAHGMPLHHLALRWALRSDKVTSAIIGARTVNQLDDTLDAINGPAPSQALLDAIDSIAPVN